MVGPPKTLHDLRRIEAAVRVTCRTCGHVELLDREELIGQRFALRRSCDWMVVVHDMRCGSARCDSTNVRVEGAPYSQSAAELQRRRSATITVTLALTILHRAAYPGGQPPLPTEAVRLALRATAGHLSDRSLLDEYYRHYVNPNRLASESPSTALAQIVTALVAAGIPVPAEFRSASYIKTRLLR